MNAFEFGFFDELSKLAAKNRGAGGPRPANIPRSVKKGDRGSIRYKKPGAPEAPVRAPSAVEKLESTVSAPSAPAPSALDKIQASTSTPSAPASLPVPAPSPDPVAAPKPAKPGMSNLAKGILGGGAAIVGGLALRNYLRRRKLEKARAAKDEE